MVMIMTSLLTPPPPPEKVDRIIWNRSYLNLPPDERSRYRGWKDFRLWWLLFVGVGIEYLRVFPVVRSLKMKHIG